MSHANAHQNTSSTERAPNKQENRMTCLVDVSQLLSLATPALAQQNSHGSRDVGYAWTQWCRFLLTKGDLDSAATEC